MRYYSRNLREKLHYLSPVHSSFEINELQNLSCLEKVAFLALGKVKDSFDKLILFYPKRCTLCVA